MDQALVQLMLAVQQRAIEDDGYLALLREYAPVNARLVAVFQEMTPPQQDAITDYLSLLSAMHLRMLELALLTAGRQ